MEWWNRLKTLATMDGSEDGITGRDWIQMKRVHRAVNALKKRRCVGIAALMEAVHGTVNLGDNGWERRRWDHWEEGLDTDEACTL